MIHKFERLGQKMVLDVHSGAVHSVDPFMFDFLDHYPVPVDSPAVSMDWLEKTAGPSVIEELKNEVDALMEAQMLDSSPAPSEQEMVRQTGVVKALCLHVAHDCNLSCDYCFASEGTFQGDRRLMDPRTGRDALDFLIQHSGKRRQLEVDFFGGEPLLNQEAIQEMVTYGKQREKETGKNFRFTLTTNGLALDRHNMDWIHRHMDNVVLSLDGRRKVHNATRKTRRGEGSYDAVLPKIQQMAALRQNEPHYIRGTFTKKNLDFANDVQHLADLGFTEISCEPVVASPETPLALQGEDLPNIEQEYEKLARLMIQRKREGRSFRFFHFNIDLSQGPCMKKRASGCGAGTEYLAVTPEGDLYPCHQFVGESNFCLGNLSKGIDQVKLQQRFQQTTIHHKPACQRCWARYYCSGGCHANAWHRNQNLLEPDEIGCQMERARIEIALALLAAESEECTHD